MPADAPAAPRAFDALKAIASSELAGLTPSRRRFRDEAIAIARAEGLGRAHMTYAIVALDAPAADILCAGGESFHAPRMLPETGELTALAFGVCTIGPALVAKVRALFAERKMSLALALDTLGNQMLLEASRRLQDRILADVTKRGLTMAGELRAGDPGLALEAQPAVLRLAGADRIGVAATSSLALEPAKSASVMFGVGRDLPVALWSRCDDCRSRKTCAIALRAAAA
ncbi:MAG: hypothetical protein H6871_07260 [Methylobacteriaceae bacterium]|nr:hypothetical protein [Methylobacteriaceae bacterium]